MHILPERLEVRNAGIGQVLLDPAGPLFGGLLGLVLLLAQSFFSLGCLLFAIAILRAGTTASFAGLLLLGGIPLAFQPSVPQLLGTKSKEAYLANARRPETHDRYLQLMRFAVAEPEWHDGEIAFTMT
jgi:hypothetical protein